MRANQDYIRRQKPDGLSCRRRRWLDYLTGDTWASSNIDYWVRCGNPFDCWHEGDEVIFQLSGYAEPGIPEHLQKLAENLPFSLGWCDRGFLYEVHWEEPMFANGSGGCIGSVVVNPEDGRDPWMYRITKTGRGNDLWSAMNAAFEAPEVEVVNETAVNRQAA
ncbi:MAG: hypothetical protein BWY68_00289 [bacterium ADurb.Bin400]|nr:MAG: hypothetical protein BWY68_00289 [bacterium ADurb.Bin400]